MIYILELEKPLGNCNHQARFYVGWTRDEYTLSKRLECHAKGQGAAFTRAAVERGIAWQVALIINEGDKALERRIKKQKNTKRFIERFLKRQGS